MGVPRVLPLPASRLPLPASRLPLPGILVAHVPTAVFVFISHLTVPTEDHDELERHFRERSGLVDAFPGFLYLQLLSPQSGTATHTFLTAWESRDAFRRYMQSEEHALSHGREPGEIMRRTQVRHEAYEVILDSRREPEWSR
jgi:heme-degrading monooxygenase HmoA